ncbi:hypothetical protein AA0112_g10222 [Alternaria arborescens]|uniref:hypothetical protein n=1 Tax=Alternaria arborescens TaxID=156630 RepID=UPI0010758A9D|nr:hypothetical protein AA0111_g11617 [Alternaria arborescens]RYN21543.1 hypothetical protein AA0112_g10222 [Alternaria arborescens]RYO15740.1 hypothetical protein AA0111_g11617 [Alternaria arborescens]
MHFTACLSAVTTVFMMSLPTLLPPCSSKRPQTEPRLQHVPRRRKALFVLPR